MANTKFIKLLQENEIVLKLAKIIKSHINNDKKTLNTMETIYINYAETCVKTTFEVEQYINILKNYIAQLETAVKNHQSLISDINQILCIEYCAFVDGEITYQVSYNNVRKEYIFLTFNNQEIPVRALKWERFKNQVMRYVSNFNPNNIQNHKKGQTYKIVIKTKQFILEYNYSKKLYYDMYWDLNYTITRHTVNNIHLHEKSLKKLQTNNS